MADLIRLINNDNETVRKLAEHLLRERDPRKEIGLDAWGRLLETRHGHKTAADILQKHFGTKELTPEWFKQRLLSTDGQTVRFAQDLLLKVHDPKRLKTDFFVALVDAQLRFIFVDTNGRVSDRGIWNKCALKHYLKTSNNISPSSFFIRWIRISVCNHSG